MRSTANDLALWNAALIGGKILQKASLHAMIRPGRLNDGRKSGAAILKSWGEPRGEYGLGPFIDRVEGPRKIGHGRQH